MMTSVFNAPSYQHMVNTNKKNKFYALQNDLTQPAMLHQDHAETKSSSQILDTFLASIKPQKTVVLRHSPKIAVVPQNRADDSNSMHFIANAYTNTDVVELVPSVDLSDNNIDLLESLVGRLRDLGLRMYNSSPLKRPLSVAYAYIADILESFALDESNDTQQPGLHRMLLDKLKVLWQYLVCSISSFACCEMSSSSMFQTEYRRRMQENAIILQSGPNRRMHPARYPMYADGLLVPKVIVPPSRIRLQQHDDYQHLPLLHDLM